MSKATSNICMVTLTQIATQPGAHNQVFQASFSTLPSKADILTALSGENAEPSQWATLVDNMEDVDILDYQDAYEQGDLEFECIMDGEVVGKITLCEWPLY